MPPQAGGSADRLELLYPLTQVNTSPAAKTFCRYFPGCGNGTTSSDSRWRGTADKAPRRYNSVAIFSAESELLMKTALLSAVIRLLFLRGLIWIVPVQKYNTESTSRLGSR